MSTERVVPFERPPADPPHDGLLLAPDDPLKSARAWLHRAEQSGRLWHRGGVFHRYRAPGYAAIEDALIRAELYAFLDTALRQTKTGKIAPFQPTRPKVDLVLDAIRSLCHLDGARPLPCWLEPAHENEWDAMDTIAAKNGLVHLPTRTLRAAAPAFFTLNVLTFAYNPRAAAPARWMRFLDQLWPDEPEPIATLQEYIGYLLTQDTRYQKILMLVGPKRSGKGTIGRVLQLLLGAENVCAPTLGTISGQFGRAGLIGKTAALIADARISGRADTAAITECLLSISGEDPQTIPRKFLPDWHGRLPCRFVLLTNELPKIEDASGALASRFVILPLQHSWLGREDTTLFDSFIPELPGILNWALDGLARLRSRGRFLQPQTGSDMVQEFEDLGSPVGAFLRECCVVGPGNSVSRDGLIEAWKRWCKDNGRDHPGTSATFGRNLNAQIPGLGQSRPRVSGERTRFYEGLRLKDPTE